MLIYNEITFLSFSRVVPKWRTYTFGLRRPHDLYVEQHTALQDLFVDLYPEYALWATGIACSHLLRSCAIVFQIPRADFEG